jgi:Transposase domain (DUF772)
MSMKKSQPGFVDLETRANKLTEMGDPLVDLKLRIDWEAFRVDLVKVPEKTRQNNAGAKPIDVILLFQMWVLQHLYNLSDEALESQVRDRLSFRRFLALQLEDRVPVEGFCQRVKVVERLTIVSCFPQLKMFRKGGIEIVAEET